MYVKNNLYTYNSENVENEINKYLLKLSVSKLEDEEKNRRHLLLYEHTCASVLFLTIIFIIIYSNK